MADAVADQPEPDLRGPLRYLCWLARCQLGRVLLGAGYGSAWMVTLALPPYLLQEAIDDGLRPGDTAALWGWAGALLGVGIVNAWLAIGRHRTMSMVRIDANFRTTRLTVEHVTRLGAELPRRVSAGEVVTIGLGDVTTIATALTVAGPGVGAVIAYAFVGFLLWTVSWLLAVVVLLGVPALVVLVGPLLRRLLVSQAAYRGAQSALSELLVDVIEGLRVLNAFGGKGAYAQRYRVDSQALRDYGYRVAGVTSWISGLAVGLPSVFLAGVTWLAARMAVDGSISIGQLVAVYGYAAVLVVPVASFIEGGDQVSRAVVSARRLLRFLSLAPERDGLSHPADLSDPPAEPAVLEDPDSGVRIEPFSFTAIVSSRPEEATALLERLAGFTPSAVTWGGTPLREIAPGRVRPRLVLADNDATLFAGTLRAVLQGRTDAADDALVAAMHAAAADDIVRQLRHGLAARIEQGGTNLSGGQRQRVRLARVLVADPEVLLAVDPTSALDAHTEALVAARVRAVRQGRTTVVTTSSPPLLAQADRVCLLADGRLAAAGTHRDLLTTSPAYRAIVARDIGEDPANEDPAGAGGCGPDVALPADSGRRA
jgi:ABC-type multidrug transport system fused ATPase/permease subunit